MNPVYLILLILLFTTGFYFFLAHYYRKKQAKTQEKVTALKQRQAVLETQKHNLQERRRHEKDSNFRPRDELIDRLSDAGDLRD